MRSYRWLIIAAGVLVFLALVALGPGTMWLNSFIHSDAFRHEVETKASAAANGQVEIKQINFSIWSGVKLDGLAVKVATPQGTVVAQVESVDCSYSLAALFSRRLQFDAVTLVKPQIVLTQEAPSTVPTPATPPVATTPATPTETQSGKTSPVQVILEAAKISDGSLAIRDETNATKANLEGIQVSADTGGYYDGKDITGKLRIATITLPQNLSLTDFSTPFTYRTGSVAVSPIEATAFGGKITADYKLDPGAPSLLEVNATGIDVAQVGHAANPNSSTVLSGALALQSKWHDAETGKLTGEGDAQITGGRLQGVPVLSDLATALQIKELRDPVLKSVTTHFQVAEGTTRFSNLRIESDVFEMTGDGTIDPQGRLDANMVLTLHGDAMGAISGAVASVFSKLPGGGGSIPFHISGTVGSPQTDLATRAFLSGSKVQNTVKKAINRFFH
jgi:uncharacterized protein involved in outer membrane biogenesis